MLTPHDREILRTGRDIGCPMDQMFNFRVADYLPQPKQMRFHAACRLADAPGGPRHIGFGGSRGPGKSHAMSTQVWLDDCQRFPGLKCLILRKVGKALKESTADLRIKILGRHIPHSYNRTDGRIEFPNGSRVILGHYKDDRTFEQLVGLEYDVIAVEECTTLDALKYGKINTNCRTSKYGWRPRIYSNANPGGIGHQFYYKKFIKGAADDPSVAFIHATYLDNKFLDADYADSFNDLPDWLRRAYLLGDWNIHVGTYFTNFDEAIHVIPPHDVKAKGYIFYLVLDYGFIHPTVALLLAVSGERVYVIDEYRASRRLTLQHSKMLDTMLTKWKLFRRDIRTFVIGQDAWHPHKDGTTVADEYEDCGWRPEQAIPARVQGAQEVSRRLGDQGAGLAPSLFIFSSCTGLIEQLPQMQCDPKRFEDVLKVNVDGDGYGGDDYYDALRYGLQAIAEDSMRQAHGLAELLELR